MQQPGMPISQNKKLTKNQEDFFLEYFFKLNRHADCKTIALTLIRNGECIVAGKDCIWKGGIGNFISLTEDIGMFVGCVKYNFDLKYFMSSEYFKDIHRQVVLNVYEELETKQKQYEELYNIFK